MADSQRGLTQAEEKKHKEFLDKKELIANKEINKTRKRWTDKDESEFQALDEKKKANKIPPLPKGAKTYVRDWHIHKNVNQTCFFLSC